MHCQDTPRIEPGNQEYFEEKELPNTTLITRGSQVLNLAWLRHAGNFLNKLSQKMTCLKTCQQCQRIFYKENTRENDISAIYEPRREGQRRMANLDYFERGYVHGMTVVRRKLSVIAFQINLKEKLKIHASRFLDLEWMTCRDHQSDLKFHFLDLLITENIFQWCVHINRLLTGAQTSHGNSIMEQRAVQMFAAHRKRTLAVQKM